MYNTPNNIDSTVHTQVLNYHSILKTYSIGLFSVIEHWFCPYLSPYGLQARGFSSALSSRATRIYDEKEEIYDPIDIREHENTAMASSKNSENGDSIDQSTGVTYEGSCHCKAVLYSVKLPSEISNLPVISCNCTYIQASWSLISLRTHSWEWRGWLSGNRQLLPRCRQFSCLRGWHRNSPRGTSPQGTNRLLITALSMISCINLLEGSLTEVA